MSEMAVTCVFVLGILVFVIKIAYVWWRAGQGWVVIDDDYKSSGKK